MPNRPGSRSLEVLSKKGEQRTSSRIRWAAVDRGALSGQKTSLAG